MPRSEKNVLPPGPRVTSRYFDKVSTLSPPPASLQPNTDFDPTRIPKTPPMTRPLPRAQVEVVILPYRPKRKATPPSATEGLPNALTNIPDLSRFAYAPPKTPRRQNTVIVSVVPQRDSTVSRFFATKPTRVRRPLTPTPLHHHLVPKGSVDVEESPAPTKKGPRKRKASLSVPTDLNNEKKVKLDSCTCQTLDEHLQAAKPKLIQGKPLVADNPWKLIIAVSLLNKTRGALSIPVFWEIMEKWPTPEALAMDVYASRSFLRRPISSHGWAGSPKHAR
ncbi:hypothetical protein FS837_000806 [Tulasnella sp. UAMH 9824]|nr:hypothetical protein FS837_000806 [Tulasnella sp. UAMH 9824]